MVSTSDETTIAASVAGVQATLAEHGKRFDRVETKLDAQDGKLDKVIDRIDVLYPRLSVVESNTETNARDIAELKTEMKELHKQLRWVLFTAIGGIIGLFGDAIWAGLVHFGR